MACGICGSTGHNRRTHAEHEAPQPEALLETLPVGEYIGAAGEQEAPDRFDPSIPPGGFVCSVCGTPVESEPCQEHQPVAWTNAQGSPIKLTEADPALGGPLTNVADYVVSVDFKIPDGTALDLAEYFAAVNDTSSKVGKEEDGSTSADADAGQSHSDNPGKHYPVDVTHRSRNGLLVPGPGVVIERGTVDPTDPGWPIERATHELIGEQAEADIDLVTETLAADFTVARCQECGEPLDDGQTLLCGSCAIQDQHECEPAPDQVYYCRHCGADLMVDPEPVDPVDTPTPPWRTVRGPFEPIRITLPGVYELDANEYHDPAVTGEWLSNSDARQLTDDGCPAQFRYDRDNGVRKRSDAFAVGHAYHATVLGKGETIAVRPLVNPDDPDQVWNSWRTKAAQNWKAEQEAAGRSVILPEDAAVVEAMAAAVHQKPRAHELLSQPGRPEMALFWIDPVTGVKRRCLVDYLPDAPGPDGIMRPVDLKSADEVAPNGSMEKKLYDHCWHRQAVTIADGIRALGLADEVEFYFIVQSKKAPHLVTVVVLDADAERIGGIENLEAMRVYQQCIESGVWPDYAPDTVTLTVPPWIARIYEDDIEVSH
jgi:hypothetical protein